MKLNFKEYSIIVLALGILIFGGVKFIGFSSNKGPANDKLNQNAIVVAFGDSLVKGQGATPGNDFVSDLSARIGIPIINEGQGGDTTASALGRLDSDVISKNPNVVIVLLSGNDALQQVPITQTFQNLKDIVEKIKQAGAKVLLVGEPGGVFLDPYASRFSALAKNENVAYIPNILNGLIGHNDLMADAIHPNDKGNKIMADRIEADLRKLLQK